MNFAAAEIWIAAAIGLGLGAVVGALMQRWLQRRRDGGRTVGELHAELERYRAEVNEHFARTSELFVELTDRYRDVYEHLSDGAQSLCASGPRTHELDPATRELLTLRSRGRPEEEEDEDEDGRSAGERARSTL